METIDVVELARQVAAETSPTDRVGKLARTLARAVLDQEAKIDARRAADLTSEEVWALRSCTVHCQDEGQLAQACRAIDKVVRHGQHRTTKEIS